MRRRSRYAKQRSRLTDVQETHLLIGGPSPFKSEEERRVAYLTNREELLCLMPHCFGWIVYEGGSFLPDEVHRMSRALERLGIVE